MYIEEIKSIKSSPRELRRFGITVGAALLAIAAVFALVRDEAPSARLVTAAGALIVLGLIAPRILFPLQKAWMGVAVTIGWVVSRAILIVLFYLVFTPLSLAARLTGKHFLALRFRKGSYWRTRVSEPATKRSMEQQF